MANTPLLIIIHLDLSNEHNIQLNQPLTPFPLLSQLSYLPRLPPARETPIPFVEPASCILTKLASCGLSSTESTNTPDLLLTPRANRRSTMNVMVNKKFHGSSSSDVPHRMGLTERPSSACDFVPQEQSRRQESGRGEGGMFLTPAFPYWLG